MDGADDGKLRGSHDGTEDGTAEGINEGTDAGWVTVGMLEGTEIGILVG